MENVTGEAVCVVEDKKGGNLAGEGHKDDFDSLGEDGGEECDCRDDDDDGEDDFDEDVEDGLLLYWKKKRWNRFSTSHRLTSNP